MLERAAELDYVAKGVAELDERALGGVAHGLPIRNLGDIGLLPRFEHKSGLVADGRDALQPLELLVVLVEL